MYIEAVLHLLETGLN